MDIRKQLLQAHSKENKDRIVAYIGGNNERFSELMHLFFNGEYRLAQRAAWPMSDVAKKRPELISPYLEQLIDNLESPDLSMAVKRNTVRILQGIEIPEPLWGKTLDICFKLLNDGEEPIAVKVFSMTVLGNIIRHVPELKEELIMSIENQMPYQSTGFKSRGKKVLQLLAKLPV